VLAREVWWGKFQHQTGVGAPRPAHPISHPSTLDYYHDTHSTRRIHFDINQLPQICIVVITVMSLEKQQIRFSPWAFCSSCCAQTLVQCSRSTRSNMESYANDTTKKKNQAQTDQTGTTRHKHKLSRCIRCRFQFLAPRRCRHPQFGRAHGPYASPPFSTEHASCHA